MDDIQIREAIPGDYSRAIVFYFELFKSQYHFNGSAEKYFIGAMLDVFDDTDGNKLWVAVRNEKIVGSVAIVKKADNEAQFRLFGVSQEIQGYGIGNKLMKIAMDFCQQKNYRHVILWTINILKSALHIYEKFGFYHTEDKPNNEWADYPMIEEKFEYNAP